MKSSFWVICGVTLLCIGSARCSGHFLDNDEIFLDKTRDEEKDTEWELYKARNTWNDLTNEISRLSRVQYTEETCEKDDDCEGNRICGGDDSCVCKDGYEGDNCEEVTGCKELKPKCDKIGKNCIFDESVLTKATCECESPLKYDSKDNKCRQKCSDGDCKNEGKCEGEEEKFCECEDGTEGDLCEIVKACEKGGKYEKCKDEKGTCGFKDGKPVCECGDDENEKLIETLGHCEVACDENKKCVGNRECNLTHEFCQCIQGYEGDSCDDVTGCKTLKKTCDKIGKKSCVFDKDAPGKATCVCEEGFKYNLTGKICSRACSKDGKCEGNRECNVDKFCVCKSGYEGDDCDVITGCKDLKEKCDKISTKCIFDESAKKATCECKDGFTYDAKENKCRSACSEDEKCKGNGECNDDNFCVCNVGYEGDDCDVITGCKTLKEKCDQISTKCIFDESAKKATCECKEGLTYDAKDNKCRKKCNDDDCQNEGTCEGEEEEKFCKCEDGTEGDFCEIIKACGKGGKYEKCKGGKGTCGFKDGQPECKCGDDEEMEFFKILGHCEVKCDENQNCDGNRVCNTTGKFCQCINGYEGDNCDEVTGCKTLKETCDKIGKKSCVFDKNAPEKATCECDEGYKYNSTEKNCSRNFCEEVCGNKDGVVCGGDTTKKDQTICSCKNNRLAFHPDDKECKTDYCKDKCGKDRTKIVCEGDIFDKDIVECVCTNKVEDFIKGEKKCKINQCKRICGTDEGIKCDGDQYTTKTKNDCKCEDADYKYNGEKCQKKCNDGDCENEGKCKGNEDDKLCVCKDGTEGDFCEIVKACGKGGKYEKCKDEKGTCGFKDGNPVCECGDDEKMKSFEILGHCEVECETKDDCSGNRECNTTQKFCQCIEGYEGDSCDEVTGCKTLKAACDKIGKKSCVFDKDAPGKATCECDDGYKYNPKAKNCGRPCPKEGKCEGNRDCNSDKFCVCKDGYEGDDCEKITGCKDLQKKCEEISTKCIFDESAKKATCECKDGFTYDAKENKCQPKFCFPKNPCPKPANCMVDESTGIGYCQCPENQYFHHINNKCQDFANKCLLRKTPCDENYNCVDGKCVCKYTEGEDKECKPKLCSPNPCFTGAKCSEDGVRCYCEEGKYFNGKKCEVKKCNLKEYKKNCTCPTDTERKEKGEECVNKKDEEKCDKECGYGMCVKKGKTEYCKCFPDVAISNGTLCILKKSFCATITSQGQLQEDSMTCKCEGKFKQADDGITCILKTCDDDDVKKVCASIGGECKMDWKKGYDCECPSGYVKDENGNGKCTDPCSIEENIKKCGSKDQFCHNSYSDKNKVTSTCICPPSVDKDADGRCSKKAQNSYLIKNIPVLKKMYGLNPGINKVLLNAHLIASLQQTFKKTLLDYGYLFDYNVQGDVVNCSVLINFKSSPDKKELEKIKMAAKKFSNVCDECDEAVVWPPTLFLSDTGLKEVETQKEEFCDVKDRLCGNGASCIEDKEAGKGKCFCDEGYKLIEYSIKVIGNYEVQRCEDIDECAAGTHRCSGNTICRNTFGNYSCICKDGFKKKEKPSDPETDKADCVDMCTPSPCQKGKCVLKGNTFDCQCSPGAGGSLCDREDDNYISAKKSTVVVGAVLGTILAVGAIAVLYYIIKRKKRSGSEDFMPAARMDHAEMTERRHMRGVTNKAYE